MPKLTAAQVKLLESADCNDEPTGIHRPGKFKQMVKRLVESGYLRHVGMDTVTITDAGRKALSGTR